MTAIAALLAAVLIPALPEFSDVANAEDVYYADSASNTIGQVQSISIHDPAGTDSVAYCFNRLKQWPGEHRPSTLPKGPAYTKLSDATAAQFAEYAAGVQSTMSEEDLKKAVLMTMYHGYPSDKSGFKTTYNLTDDEFRTVTQKVLWYFTDNNVSPIDEFTFTGGSASNASAQRMYNAAQALLAKAQGTADYPDNYSLDLYTTTDADTGSTQYQNLLCAEPSQTTSITINKVWSDNNDTANKRPSSDRQSNDYFGKWLTLQQTVNGQTTTVTGYAPTITADASDANKWTVTYSELPAINGTYSVVENIPSGRGYTADNSTVSDNGTMKNTFEEEKPEEDKPEKPEDNKPEKPEEDKSQKPDTGDGTSYEILLVLLALSAGCAIALRKRAGYRD